MNSSYKKFDRTTLSYERSPDEIKQASLARLASAISAVQSSENTLQAILQMVAHINHTDRGILCLHDPDTDQLKIVSSLNLDNDYIKNLELIKPEERTCGIAYTEKRHVIVDDIKSNPQLENFQDVIKAFEIRSSHSMPILTRSGKCIGVISIYSSIPHTSTELETFLTDISIRQISSMVERIQAEEILKEKNSLLADELKAMKNTYEHSIKLTAAQDLPTVLNEVLQGAISITNADFGSLYMAVPNSGRLEIVARSGFKEKFSDPCHSIPCRRAAQSRQRVIVDDVDKDPEILSSFPIATSERYRTVQSTPLIDQKNNLLGVVSTYYRDVQKLSEKDLRMLDLYIRNATESIVRRIVESKQQINETRFRAMADCSPILIWVTDAAGHINFVNREYQRYFDLFFRRGGRVPHNFYGIADRGQRITQFMSQNSQEFIFALIRLLQCFL